MAKPPRPPRRGGESMVDPAIVKDGIQPAVPIEQSEDYLNRLRSLVPDPSELDCKGYILGQLNKEDLKRKKRCFRCTKVFKNIYVPSPKIEATVYEEEEKTESDIPRDENGGLTDREAHRQLEKMLDELTVKPRPRRSNKENQAPCNYHPGKVVSRQWTCCGRPPMAQPCTSSQEHTPRLYAPGELEKEWEFFATPKRVGKKGQAPAAAVAIDCEMGTNDYGDTELIRVSVVDYFTGKILIDKYVWPTIRMKHYNTRFSGITVAAMRERRSAGQCLQGRQAARQALWSVIGPDTIVVGHSANSDFTSLRWMHPNVIDTVLIEEELVRQTRNRLQRGFDLGKEARAVDLEAAIERGDKMEEQRLKAEEAFCKGEYQRAKDELRVGLKALAKKHLNREIQVGGRGHDSVEDALATRDILHWHITNRLEDKVQELIFDEQEVLDKSLWPEDAMHDLLDIEDELRPEDALNGDDEPVENVEGLQA